jgi:hypothetical protein
MTRFAAVIGSAENGIDGYLTQAMDSWRIPKEESSVILEKKALLKPVYSLIDK